MTDRQYKRIRTEMLGLEMARDYHKTICEKCLANVPCDEVVKFRQMILKLAMKLED